MKFILRVVGLICLAVAAFSGLISINLPLQFGWAGLFFIFLADSTS